jgi:hypothetical protein
MNAQGQHSAAAPQTLYIVDDPHNHQILIPMAQAQPYFSLNSPNINVVPNADGSYKIVTDNTMGNNIYAVDNMSAPILQQQLLQTVSGE